MVRDSVVRFELKVLRGRGLVATDNNFVSEASSDPRCVIMVDGLEVGRTSVGRGAVDPVWKSQCSSVFVDGERLYSVLVGRGVSDRGVRVFGKRGGEFGSRERESQASR